MVLVVVSVGVVVYSNLKHRFCIFIVNFRQKTEKDSMAKVRVFGDCDTFMRCVMGELLGEGERAAWEGQREERMKRYSAKRKLATPAISSSSSYSSSSSTSLTSSRKRKASDEGDDGENGERKVRKTEGRKKSK
jgi:hypothetical protein